MANPRVFILPSGKGGDTGPKPSHTILSLKHPSTGLSTRYLVHHPPSSSQEDPFLYEILKISNPTNVPRSWLITPDLPPLELPELPAKSKEAKEEGGEEDAKPEEDFGPSQVIKDGNLFLTTPIDPLYLLLSHVTSEKLSRKFLSFDDLLEDHPESSTWSHIFKLHKTAQKALEARLLAVADTVEAGDEVMYRINSTKLYDVLISRVEATAKALPRSLTAHITRKLSKPIGLQANLTWKRQAPADVTGGIINDAELEEEVLQETGETSQAQTDSQDADSQLRREASRLNLNKENSTMSQLEDANTGTSTPAADGTGEVQTVTAQVSQEEHLPPPEIHYLSSLTHAVQFMQSYLPQSLYTKLREELYVRHPLEPLEQYQEELKKLRSEAAAAMDMSMVHTKRTIEDLEGGMSKEESEREKKRKKKEEDSKTSTAVKKLAKVDTKGMMKMTAFFKKKT